MITKLLHNTVLCNLAHQWETRVWVVRAIGPIICTSSGGGRAYLKVLFEVRQTFTKILLCDKVWEVVVAIVEANLVATYPWPETVDKLSNSWTLTNCSTSKSASIIWSTYVRVRNEGSGIIRRLRVSVIMVPLARVDITNLNLSLGNNP